MKTFNFALALILFLSACSGGGGGDTPSNTPADTISNSNTDTGIGTDQIYSLDKFNSTSPGTLLSYELTGSDSDGNQYTGSIIVANRAQTMYDGIQVTPKEVIITLSAPGNSNTVTTTSYVDGSGYLIAVNTQTTGVTCIPTSQYKLPDSVKVDDFGIASNFACSDGTTQNGSWKIEKSSNGNINLITSASSRDSADTLITKSDVSFTLDKAGNIIAFESTTTLLLNYFELTYKSL